jgi:hypothetical protein
MTFLEILKYAGAILTILVGFVGLVRPESITGFTGLQPDGSRGISEIRSVLGGLFIAIGLAPFILNDPTAFKVLGITNLGIGAARAVSMIIDGATQSSNIISLVYEIVFGVILVL